MRILVIFIVLCISPLVLARPLLEMPTLKLRQQASWAFQEQRQTEALQHLKAAEKQAQAYPNRYVAANELRYIASVYAGQGLQPEAQRVFAEAMDVAITITTWNHKLYASIGVLEMQQRVGSKEGLRANGLKAIEAGLLESIAATGQAAETGRFFTALKAGLTEEDKQAIRKRIALIPDTAFRTKALHALE